jgi:hypothetical protein
MKVVKRLTLWKYSVFRGAQRRGWVFREGGKTGKVRGWHARPRSRNSSGEISLQLTYADVVRARTPIILINKTELVKK